MDFHFFQEPPLPDDSWTAKVINRKLPLLFWFFFACSAAKEFFGAGIQCWFDGSFAGSHEQYGETICFVEASHLSSYASNKSLKVAEFEFNDTNAMIVWFPIVLFIFGLFLYIVPAIVKAFGCVGFLNVINAIILNGDFSIGQRSDDELRRLGREMYIIARSYRRIANFSWSEYLFGQHKRTIGLIFGKFLNLVVIFCEMYYLCSSGLGFDFDSLTLDYNQAFSSLYFPSVFYCKFLERSLDDVIIPHTTQCIFTSAKFFSTIVVLLWILLGYGFFLAAVDFCDWIIFVFFRKKSFFYDRLREQNLHPYYEDLEDFYAQTSFLDTLVSLKLLYDKGVVYEVAEIARAIWETHMDLQPPRRY